MNQTETNISLIWDTEPEAEIKKEIVKGNIRGKRRCLGKKTGDRKIDTEKDKVIYNGIPGCIRAI